MNEDNNDVKEEEVKLPEESSTTKETTEEEQVPDNQEATEDQGLESETAESNKGANQRIRELNQRTKDAEARAQSLADRLAEITEPVGSQGFNPQYTPQVQEGQEISPEQYQSDVVKTADALVDIKIKQNNAINRINNESSEVIRKYPQLDPDSSEFNKELSEAVTEATEAHVRNSPYSASVSKFVEKMMKPYQGAVSKEVEKVSENLARQVSESALRPTSIRKGEKTASEKSIAELRAELGVVQA